MHIKQAAGNSSQRGSFISLFLSSILILFLFAGCSSDSATEVGPNEVTITAVGLTFEAPDTLPSGWNTVRFENQSEMLHFAIFQKFPDGKGLDDHQAEVAPVFQNIMNSINGKEPADPELGSTPPEWYADVQMMGGPGFVTAGQNAETTFFLEPGTYLVECYIKTNQLFHSYNPSPDVYGMAVEITVTENPDSTAAPTPTSSLNISSERGIEMNGDPVSGENIVEVNFEDQSTYENFVGHDVQLVRLDSTSNVDDIAAWMNWTTPNGLETPAPATFIGGTNEMPNGSRSYLHLDLEPGEYMWIAEVPDPESKGMMLRFTVE